MIVHNNKKNIYPLETKTNGRTAVYKTCSGSWIGARVVVYAMEYVLYVYAALYRARQ